MVAVTPRALLASAAAAMLLFGCLPDRYSDEELTAKIAAATDGKTSDTGSGQDSLPATGCGNAKVEGTEQCDELPATTCGGCVACQRRRVLDVQNAKALVMLEDTANIQLAAKDGLSIEFWAKPSQLPKADQFAVVATLTQVPATLVTPAVVMGYIYDATKNAAYPTCLYLIGTDSASGIKAVVQSAEPAKAGQWQHLRCVYSATDRRLHLRLNGGTPGSSNAVINKVGKLLDDKSKFIFGAFEAGSDGPPFNGQLDELRIVTGAAADDFGPVPLRYAGNEPGTQLLYHMDLADGDKVVKDSSGNQLDAQQVQFAPTPGFQLAVLPSLPESCYGYSEPDAQCTGASSAPWCAK